MTWIEGEIVGFEGQGKEKLRKIKTDPGQSWNAMAFFHIRQALAAGYSHEQLRPGRRIDFRPGRGPKGPMVEEFKPPAGDSASASTHFLNPYHFIPLSRPPAGSLTPIDQVRNDWDLHGRFGSSVEGGTKQDSRFSGRILCRLTTEGPMVIGAEQRPVDPDDPSHHGHRVEPFELITKDPDGTRVARPAIPGTTLRGMISSLAEAASSSTMRVLGDATFTRRGQFGQETLSAIGRIVEVDGEPKVQPLTEPTNQDHQPEPNDYDRLRYYLDGYSFDRGASQTRVRRGTFLDQRRPDSASASNDEVWYAKIRKSQPKMKKGHLIGRVLDEPPIRGSEWEALSEIEREGYRRGLLLVFGLNGSKAKNLPPTKSHELFIPYPEQGLPPTLPIDSRALDEFHALLANSAELPRGGDSGDLPYLHAGRDRSDLRPREGDLVYYSSNGFSVDRLSYSASWRRPVPGSLHQSVAKVSKDLVPFHSGRDETTLAERLFGFVESDGQRALAGRVRFAHGLSEGAAPEGGWYEPEVTLAILASPKPPSPAFYFGAKGYLSKRDLDLSRHTPNGRKVYLHHRASEIRRHTYRGDEADDRLKQKVRPLERGTAFLFHVDFVNLTRDELGFLHYALRPTKEFRHKLGMGKPLGLGQCRVEPLALCFIDRRQCYQAGNLFDAKYQAVDSALSGDDLGRLKHCLGGRYSHEAEVIAQTVGSGQFPTRQDLVEEVSKRIPRPVRNAIETLGDPERVTTEVTYPRLQGQEGEQEHFKWFVANDKPNPRSGPPIDRQFLDPTNPLKPLLRHRER